MENDKIYTCLSADMLKRGSRGYFADDLETLEKLVDSGEVTHLLMNINSKSAAARFKTETEQSYCLFYLVSVPPEHYIRPYKDASEMPYGIADRVIRKSDKAELMITGICRTEIYISSTDWISMQELYNEFEWPNGAPCGMEI